MQLRQHSENTNILFITNIATAGQDGNNNLVTSESLFVVVIKFKAIFEKLFKKNDFFKIAKLGSHVF